MAEQPWRYRSRSKVMVRDTPSHGSDHLCLIWKESIHNCRWYRADTACRTDGRTDGRTDRRTDGRSETSIPPQQLRCAGGIINHNVCDVLSVWPCDAICHHRARLTLARVMVCCLTEPSHYLNQCWLINSRVQWQSPMAILQEIFQSSITLISLKITYLNLKLHQNYIKIS